MVTPATGACRCGTIRYSVAITAPPIVYCCHCRFCQAWSGSAFTQQALVMAGAIQVEGAPAEFSLARDDGSVSTQFICPACHARLWNRSSKTPAIAALRAGTLDCAPQLVPALHMWVRSKQPWIALDPALPAYPENPPPAAWLGLINR